MPKRRKSTWVRKKKTVKSSVLKMDSQKKQNGKVKTPQRVYNTRFQKVSPVSSHSETSPFRGFPENVTKGKVKEPKLYESYGSLTDSEVPPLAETDEKEKYVPFIDGINKSPYTKDIKIDNDDLPPVKIVEGEESDPFDKLLDDNYKSHFTKDIKTYSNKNKRHFSENGLVEFQDDANRNDVVKWLNDTRNLFDQLTQSQSDLDVNIYTQMSLDVPSVSQQKTTKINHSSRGSKRTRQSPYKLRARSLDIHIKKNSHGGRRKSHSFSGDSPAIENYSIEEVVTPTPADEDAKIIIDLMEDEYLDNIEKELQQDRKDQDGWNRIKDMNKSLSVKKPKQLNIVKRGSPSDSSKKFDSVDNNTNLTYDYDILEHYFIENMEKLLRESNKSCGTSTVISTVLDCGKSFVTSLKKLAVTDHRSLEAIQPVIFELQNIISCKRNTLTASTQTILQPSMHKYVQTESSSVHFGVQIEPSLVHVRVQTTETALVHESVQTDNNKNEKMPVHQFVQTEIDQTDAEVQTDNLRNDDVPRRGSSRTNSTPSDIFFLSETERREITKALNDDFTDGHAKKTVDENKSNTDYFDDDLDFNYNTEDIMKEISKPNVAEEKQVEDPGKVQTAESVMLVSTEFNNNVGNKGKKRQSPESPVCDSEAYRTKRPCAKFIDEDLSVNFSSQEEEQIVGRKKFMQFSEDSDNYDQCLVNALKQFEESVEEKSNTEVPPQTRTQEQIEELENMIYNATKCKPVMPQNKNAHPNNTETPQRRSCHMDDDDMDYFKTSSGVPEVNTIAKQTIRRSLFDSKPERGKSPQNSFSESLFISDRNNTVVADCTLTKDNVDVIMKEIYKDEVVVVNDDVDKEVEEIFEPSKPRVVVLQNLLLQKGGDVSVTGADCWSQRSDFSDMDVVECTPVKGISSFSQHRGESALDVTLPPPLEFQDTEKQNLDKDKDDEVSLIAPVRRPLAVINKITSTPVSQKQDSEPLSISPISVAGTSKKPSKLYNESNQENRKPAVKSSPLKNDHRRPTSEPRIKHNHNLSNSDPNRENRRMCSVYDMAQQQFTKFSPLTIVKRPQAHSSLNLSSTPKQKSILNYIRPSQESPKSQQSQKSESFEDSGRRKPCIACSRVSKDQVLAISSLTHKKLATYSASFTPKVTHLIVSVNESNRLMDHTIKYVSAVASGIWVLNFGWVQQCLLKNALVPEEPYEVLDVTGTAGPQRARLMRTTKPLLKGYKIHAAAPFISTTQREIENLIRLLGGKVVPSPEHLLDKNGYICVIVTEVRATQDFDLYETWLEVLKVVTVDMEWLSRSVGEYRLLNLRPFTLCSNDGIENLGYPPDLTAKLTDTLSQQTLSSVPST